MNDLIKKLEEQITFLQYEISQISEEMYSHQKEILCQKKEIEKLKLKIINMEENRNKLDFQDDPLPPHY
tara:strand:- start:1780 stop:1986 length:207 start_codon:yes stop_codon:yes gene_type:complete